MHIRDRFRGNTGTRSAAIAAGVAGLVAAGIANAVPATADPAQDDQYYGALQQIYPGRDLGRPASIHNAHLICDHLGRGDGFDVVVNDLRAGDDNMSSVEQNQQEVRLAQSTYCP